MAHKRRENGSTADKDHNTIIYPQDVATVATAYMNSEAIHLHNAVVTQNDQLSKSHKFFSF